MMNIKGNLQGAAIQDNRNGIGLIGWITFGSMAMLLAATAAVPSHAKAGSHSTAGLLIHASEAGAALNTDLIQGGGTDDTAVLQAILNRAAKGTPVHLIVDGRALVSGLNVHANTTIECLAGAGLYLKDGSSRAIIRNAHRSRDAVTDKYITIRGCFLNGNRKNQPSAAILRSDYPADIQGAGAPSNREADGTWLSGMQFLGVNDLTIEHVTLWNVRAFGALIANAERITIRDVTIDHGGGPNAGEREYENTDGLHFKGPLRYLTVDGLRARVGDDALALNSDEADDLVRSNDFGPYVRSGPITDVTVNNVQLMETLHAIRLLSAKQRIDRISISNVSGTIRGNPAVKITHWLHPASSGFGNFGSIQFNNVNVDRLEKPTPTAEALAERKKWWARLKAVHKEWYNLVIKEFGPAVETEFSGGPAHPLFNINAHVERLVLRNIMSTIDYAQPIVRLGPDAHVNMMTAELSLQDPKWQAVPLMLEAGARINRLNYFLDWQGDEGVDASHKPIESARGSIGQVHWMNTPPL